MGEQTDAQPAAETGIKYTTVKKESSEKAWDAVTRSSSFTKEAMEDPPPSACMKDLLWRRHSCQKSWKKHTRRSTTLVRSPEGVREQNDAAVSAAQKRYVRQQRQCKAAVKVMSSIFRRMSPVIVLKRARDCYVTSLGSFASHVSYSAASGLTYGAGHSSLDNLPGAWRSGSARYHDQEQQLLHSERSLSAAFKQSFNDTAPRQLSRSSSRTFPWVPPHTRGPASRSLRVSSARASSRRERIGLSVVLISPAPLFRINSVAAIAHANLSKFAQRLYLSLPGWDLSTQCHVHLLQGRSRCSKKWPTEAVSLPPASLAMRTKTRHCTNGHDGEVTGKLTYIQVQ